MDLPTAVGLSFPHKKIKLMSKNHRVTRLLFPLLIALLLFTAVLSTPVAAFSDSALTGGWWTDFTSEADNSLWMLRGTSSKRGIDSEGLYVDHDAGVEALVSLYHPGGDFALGMKPAYSQGPGSLTYIRAGIFPWNDFSYHDEGGAAWWATCNTGSLFSQAAANEYIEKSCLELPEGFYVLRVKAQGSQRRHVRELHLSASYVFEYDPNTTPSLPEPPPPPPPPLQSGACYLALDPAGLVLTATNNITDATGITNTVTISTPANLVQNAGFEAGYVVPDLWTFDQPLYAPGMWIDSAPEEERGKIIRSYTTPALELTQAISLPTSPAYLIGLDVDYPAGANNATLRIGLDQVTISPAAGDWRTISDTITTSGERTIQLQLPATTALDEIRADDVFVVPVETDEFGAVLGVHCAAVGEHYQASNPPPPPTPVPPVPTSPTGPGTYPGWNGTGGGLFGITYCTTCPVPGSILEIGAWLGWIGCLLANLYFCHLNSTLGNIYNILLNISIFLPEAFNALMSFMDASIQFLVDIWNNGVVYAIETVWGWFAYSLGWAASAIMSVGFWAIGIIANIWNVYIPAALASLWNGAMWLANAGQYVGIWLYSGFINASSWVVGLFWDVVAFLDPWTLLMWWLNLPITQHILNAFYYWGLGTEIGQLVLFSLAAVFQNIYDSLLEMWELLRIVFNAFRGVFVGDEYSVFININGEDLEIIEPAALHESGMNGTKMLWLGLAALATADYALEVFPLSLPLWLAVGGVAFGVIAWTMKQWQEILPFG